MKTESKTTYTLNFPTRNFPSRHPIQQNIYIFAAESRCNRFLSEVVSKRESGVKPGLYP
jgi:hypothetical protein